MTYKFVLFEADLRPPLVFWKSECISSIFLLRSQKHQISTKSVSYLSFTHLKIDLQIFFCKGLSETGTIISFNGGSSRTVSFVRRRKYGLRSSRNLEIISPVRFSYSSWRTLGSGHLRGSRKFRRLKSSVRLLLSGVPIEIFMYTSVTVKPAVELLLDLPDNRILCPTRKVLISRKSLPLSPAFSL